MRFGVARQLGLMLLVLAAVAALYQRRPKSAGPFLRQGRLRPALQLAPLAATMLLVLLWAACGGGPPPPQDRGTPAGTYNLTLTATAGGVSKTTSLKVTVN